MSLKVFLFLPIILFLACTEQNDTDEDQIYFSDKIDQTEDIKKEHPVNSASNEFKELENFLIEVCRDKPQPSECQEFEKQRQAFYENRKSLQPALNQLLTDLLPVVSFYDLRALSALGDSGTTKFPKLQKTPEGGTWYEEDVKNKVEDFLKSKYSRRQLGFFNDQELSKPEEDSYAFQFIEGNFLESFTSIYQKLRNSNPWPLQGILARVCGMEALKSVDRKNIDDDFLSIAFYLAQRMDEITTEGVFPSKNSQYIYEYCTGRSFFTGLPVSELSLILDNFMQLEFVVYKLWDKNKVKEVFDIISQAVKEDVNRAEHLVHL